MSHVKDAHGSEAEITEIWRGWADCQPQRPAFTMLDGSGAPFDSLDYGTLHSRALRLARRLRQRMPPHSVAILMYPPGLHFVVALVACIYAGILPTPVHPAKRNRSNQRIIKMMETAGAAALLSDQATMAEVRGVADFDSWPKELAYIVTDSEPDADDAGGEFRPYRPNSEDEPIFLQFTSGSTSLPKGVTITHGGLLENLRMIVACARSTPETTLVSWLPHYHDLGLVAHILHSLYCGGHCILLNPTTAVTHPLRWLQAISRYRAHYSGAPDFAFRLCLAKITERERDSLDLSSLRLLINAAEPISADTFVRFMRYFEPAGLDPRAMVPAYGLAEATVFVSASAPGRHPIVKRISRATYLREGRVVENPVDEEDALSLVGCGTPFLDEEIRIVDPLTFHALAPGQVGEVWVGGRHLMAGYYRDQIATEERFGRMLGSNTRYLRTGDLGFCLDGELFISGRSKDVLIARGVNYYPQDIEQAASGASDGIRCAAAFGVVGEDGDELVLVLELEREAIKRLQRDARAERDAMDRVVDAVRQVADLPIREIAMVYPGDVPMTSSGKVCRGDCKKKHLNKQLRVVAAWSGRALRQVQTGGRKMSNADRIIRAVIDMGPEHLQVFGHLTRVLEEKCGIGLEALDLDHSLFFYGVDSLQIVDVQAGLERALGHSIATELFFSSGTVLQLVDELVKSLHTVSGVPPQQQIAADVERLGTEMVELYRQASANGRRTGGKGVLLTGATGYVGAYLLQELLQTTGGPVYCITRAANEECGKERIVRNAARYEIHFSSNELTRIRPVVADISRERIGLSEPAYERLVGDIRAIYHCAAIDNFYLPYSVLRPSNVMGTIEMLRMALHDGVIPLYHVSSCAASLLEESECEDGGLVNGYAKTKYVAEQVVRRLIAVGFPGVVYRFGYLYSLKADMADAGESFETFLSSIFHLGRLPGIDIVFDLTPVEYAAKSIVYGASLPELDRPVNYTLYNPVPLRWSDVAEYLTELREGMRVVPLAEFEQQFHEYVERSTKKSAKLLRSVVSPRLEQQVNRMFRDVAVDRLALMDVWCPPCDRAFARHYVDLVLGSDTVPEGMANEMGLVLDARGA